METIEALNSRATAKTYGLTAPTKEHLAIALQAAVRAPDHGRLRPSRFMLIEGDQRRKLGAAVRRAIFGCVLQQPDAHVHSGPPNPATRRRQ